jgi:hypothetical protein
VDTQFCHQKVMIFAMRSCMYSAQHKSKAPDLLKGGEMACFWMFDLHSPDQYMAGSKYGSKSSKYAY